MLITDTQRRKHLVSHDMMARNNTWNSLGKNLGMFWERNSLWNSEIDVELKRLGFSVWFEWRYKVVYRPWPWSSPTALWAQIPDPSAQNFLVREVLLMLLPGYQPQGLCLSSKTGSISNATLCLSWFLSSVDLGISLHMSWPLLL